MTIADLDATLRDTRRVLFDSSVLIAYHNPSEAIHPLAHHLLKRVEDEQDVLLAYFSVMSAMELLVRPIRAGTRQLLFMHTFLTAFPNLTVLPMDFTVAMQAATIRAVTNIRAPDAVIIASGMLAGCDAIVCNDQQWVRRLRPAFPQFIWIYLGQYI